MNVIPGNIEFVAPIIFMGTLIQLSPVVRLLEGERSAFIKVVVFFGVWLGFWLPLAIPLVLQGQWRPFQPLTWEQKLPLLTSMYLLVPLVVWEISPEGFISYSSYGFIDKWITLREAIIGFFVAVSSLIILFSIERSLGWIEWKVAPHLLDKIDSLDSGSILSFLRVLVPALLPILGLAVWIGGTEEFIFRGILLDLFWQDYPFWLSAAIASSIFALLHIIWEVRETLPQLPGLFLMGMVLTLARMSDGGSLGLAWGLHAGWIWGISSFDTVLSTCYTDKVSPWITGIFAKPLAGLLGLLLLSITGFGLAFRCGYMTWVN